MVKNLDELKERLEKWGFKIIPLLSSIEFTVNINRQPKFIIGFNPITKLFTLSVEAARRGGARGEIYSGKNLDGEGIVYMLKMELDYFKQLKTDVEAKKVPSPREPAGSVRPDRFYRSEGGGYKKKTKHNPRANYYRKKNKE